MGGVTQAAVQEDVKLRHDLPGRPCPYSSGRAAPALLVSKRTHLMRSAAILAAILCGLEARTPCLRAGDGSELPAEKSRGISN